MSALPQKIAGLLLVAGSWGGCYELAKFMMRYTYNHTLMMLRTGHWSKRRSRMLRVFGSTVGYAMVFNLILWGVTSSRFLQSDVDDMFGFGTYLLSWEFIISPWYLVMLFAMSLVTFSVMVWRFNEESKTEGLKISTYDKVTASGRIAWMASGGTLLLAVLMIFIRALKMEGSPASSLPPSGESAASAIAYGVASVSLGGDPSFKTVYEEKLSGLEQGDREAVERFVVSMKGHKILPQNSGRSTKKRLFSKDDTKKVDWALRTEKYDMQTRTAARKELHRLMSERERQIIDYRANRAEMLRKESQASEAA